MNSTRMVYVVISRVGLGVPMAISKLPYSFSLCSTAPSGTGARSFPPPFLSYEDAKCYAGPTSMTSGQRSLNLKGLESLGLSKARKKQNPKTLNPKP